MTKAKASDDFLVEVVRETQPTGGKCKLQRLLEEVEQTNSDLYDQVTKALDLSVETVSNKAISIGLERRGYKVGRDLVSEHRRKLCSCSKSGLK